VVVYAIRTNKAILALALKFVFPGVHLRYPRFMQNLRPSETALKVAYGLLSLSAKTDWKYQLPPELPDLVETLIVEAKAFGYNKRVVGLSRRSWLVGFYEQFEKVMPGIFEGIGERKLFMDWAVKTAIDEGAMQVLIVGAGFDTLCLRYASNYPEVQFVEVDHPATGIAKERGVRKIGQPGNFTLLQADLGSTSLSNLLGECPDWQIDVASVAVAEGLLYYLERSSVQELFDHLSASMGPGSKVAFSYMQNHRRHGWALGMLNALREPWLSSSPIEKLSEYVGSQWQVPTPANSTDYRSGLEEFAVVKIE